MAARTLHNSAVPPFTTRVVRALVSVLKPRGFVLAGGTALSLHIGHRLSADLDLFTEGPFSTETLYRDLKEAGLDPLVLQEEKGTLVVEASQAKVAFFHYPYPFLDQRAQWKGLPIAGVIDVAAMKLIAIAQRGAKRDFVDLYFILQSAPSWKIAENAVQRFGCKRINPTHIGKSLVYFADAEADPDPEYIGELRPPWATIKQFFTKNVRQIVLDLQGAKESAP